MPLILLTRREYVFRSILVASGCSGCATAQSRTGPVQPVRSDDDSPRLERVQPDDPLRTSEELVAFHNRLRAESKLPSLRVSNKLQAAALEHARDMADHK